MTPAAFSHPLLVTQKVSPVALEEPKVDAPLGVKGDKGADAGPATKATSDAKLDFGSTVGHAEAPPHARTHTADATGANNSSIMSDASPAAAPTGDSRPSAADTPSVKADQASNTEAKPEATKPETESAPANGTGTASSDAKPAEDKPVEAKGDEIKTEAPKTETVNAETAKTETAKIENKTELQAGALKAAESKATEKAADAVKAATDATVNTPDAQKDPARLSGVAKSEPQKRTGQIAVLISRKDSKLYVRQNFSPLFEVPVTIAPSDRPLGTHVFTAEVDRADANKLRWSVVTLPASR
jgi:hypothetical protein